MADGKQTRAWVEFDRDLERVLEKDALDRDSRLLALATSAASLRSQRVLGRIIRRAMEHGVDAQALYEALLQTYLFAGYPAAIDALEVFREVSGQPVKMTINSEPPRLDLWRKRGEALCRRVYGEYFDRLQQRMAALSQDLFDWMITEGYGKVLSRPGLSARRRELCAVGSLVALGRPKQLRAHIRGAVHVGAAPAEVLEVIRQAWLVCGWPATLEALHVYESLFHP